MPSFVIVPIIAVFGRTPTVLATGQSVITTVNFGSWLAGPAAHADVVYVVVDVE
jgi:hypothetical protein